MAWSQSFFAVTFLLAVGSVFGQECEVLYPTPDLFSQQDTTTPPLFGTYGETRDDCVNFCCSNEGCNVVVFEEDIANDNNCFLYACNPYGTCDLDPGKSLLVLRSDEGQDESSNDDDDDDEDENEENEEENEEKEEEEQAEEMEETLDNMSEDFENNDYFQGTNETDNGVNNTMSENAHNTTDEASGFFTSTDEATTNSTTLNETAQDFFPSNTSAYFEQSTVMAAGSSLVIAPTYVTSLQFSMTSSSLQPSSTLFITPSSSPIYSFIQSSFAAPSSSLSSFSSSSSSSPTPSLTSLPVSSTGSSSTSASVESTSSIPLPTPMTSSTAINPSSAVTGNQSSFEPPPSPSEGAALSGLMLATVISTLVLGSMFLMVVAVVLGKRVIESYKKRHYNRLEDYLINGIYN